MDGRSVVDLPTDYRHFPAVQVANVFDKADGFVIFSHFKGHMEAGFGGAMKNLSMGFASRAQKQRMHADVRPLLNPEKCTKCGTCVEVCPTGAAQIGHDGFPFYDLEVCVGCAQCIGFCPMMALRINWETDATVFQEKLMETAAAVWRKIEGRTVLINALVNITFECDCWPGDNPVIYSDQGFLGAYHPVHIDEESLRIVGSEPFDKAHPDIPWQRQFSYAREIGFAAD
ncbi:MAG: NADH dehydrogenase subunit I [Syntrophus sp. PtaB.Bin001]|nr:MAG: NADH dehydrogenase subunit I [Syntrophus sp. PtaB.Bin001]